MTLKIQHKFFLLIFSCINTLAATSSAKNLIVQLPCASRVPAFALQLHDCQPVTDKMDHYFQSDSQSIKKLQTNHKGMDNCLLETGELFSSDEYSVGRDQKKAEENIG